MSGSFQWPGPAYDAERCVLIDERRCIDAQLALMSKPMRHMLAIVSRLIEQVFGGRRSLLPSPGLML